jgi:hypothetical protein
MVPTNREGACAAYASDVIESASNPAKLATRIFILLFMNHFSTGEIFSLCGVRKIVSIGVDETVR